MLEERIGLGGMAEVFRARRYGPGSFEKVLAIKRIRPELVVRSDWLPMFMEEARIAATLNHPNIVDVYDFGQIDGSYFIAMEYVSGVDLLALLNRQLEARIHMPLDLAAHIALQILAALGFAHERRNSDGSRSPVIHRDVSPSNVLLSYEGQVKLTDFGIAKAIGGDGPTTQPGMFKGKLSYVAPEQITGGKIDERTDLFAVGILLYTLVTNQRPFRAKEKEVQVELLLSGKYTPIRSVDSRLPMALERVVEKSLRADRALRFESASEFSAAIRNVVELDRRADYGKRLAAHLRLLFGEKAFGVVERLDLSTHTIPESDLHMMDITSPPDTKIHRPGSGVFLVLIAIALLGAYGVWKFLKEEERVISTIPAPRITPRIFSITPSPVPTKIVARATPTQVPLSATSPPTPRPVKVARKSEKSEAKTYGYLTIFPDGPFAKVFLDDRAIGNTPILNHRIESGKHKLRFENEKLNRKREVTVHIKKDITLNLTDIWGGEEGE